MNYSNFNIKKFYKIYIKLSRNQKEIILHVIIRYLDPTLIESGLLFIGNVITQFFTHVEKKIDLQILELIVKRIYSVKIPSIVQSLLLTYWRFLILYPLEIIDFLSKFLIENKICLKILIDKWLLNQQLFHGKFFKNISIKGLTILYNLKNNIIESLIVVGFDSSESTGCVELNAPLKILSILIRCLNNEILEEKNKIDDNSELSYMKMNEDENENDDIEDDLVILKDFEHNFELKVKFKFFF